MGAMASQITSLTIVYSTVYSGVDQRRPSKLCVTGLCAGNSSVICEFPAQMACNAENVSIWWRYHDHIIGDRDIPHARSCDLRYPVFKPRMRKIINLEGIRLFPFMEKLSGNEIVAAMIWILPLWNTVLTLKLSKYRKGDKKPNRA